jgi:uncharacterized protein YjeT (DUF2065 family)
MATHGYMTFAGLVLTAVGMLYLVKPDIFRRGIWRKTDIAQRNLSPEGYLKYMRGVGVVHIVAGLILLLWSSLRT